MIINPCNANEVLSGKKLYIFDMDGTIYLGSRSFPFAVSFINKLRRSGKRIVFFTNNASKNPSSYMNKLRSMGFNPESGELFTAADVTIAYLKENHPDAKVYLVGTSGLWEQFRSAGINLSCDADGNLTEGNADIVVSSFDTTLVYKKLVHACDFIREGALYLCTHPDLNCPVENGFLPDSGAIAALITASTGAEPEYFGKPCKSAADFIANATGISSKDSCIFGDRLYTDIAMRAHGICSVLVLTGESTAPEAANMRNGTGPDFVFPSLAEVDALLFD